MAQYPILDARGTVVNLVELADQTNWTAPEGTTIGPFGGSIGDMWSGSRYVSPIATSKPFTSDVLNAYAATKRWIVQSGGCAGGVPTDNGSRADIAQTIQSIDIGIISAPVNFKTPGGFLSMTRAQLVGMAQLMAQHVQASFDAEKAVGAAIAQGTIKTTADIDAFAWPSNRTVP